MQVTTRIQATGSFTPAATGAAAEQREPQFNARPEVQQLYRALYYSDTTTLDVTRRAATDVLQRFDRNRNGVVNIGANSRDFQGLSHEARLYLRTADRDGDSQVTEQEVRRLNRAVDNYRNELIDYYHGGSASAARG
jgi:hypothetical protein